MAARIVGQNRFEVGLELDLSDRSHADGNALLSCRGPAGAKSKDISSCVTGKAPGLQEDADQLGGAIALEGQ
jgi:hypothetical protein